MKLPFPIEAFDLFKIAFGGGVGGGEGGGDA